MLVKYWRMGTDPSKYIRNWITFVDKLLLATKLSIVDNSIYIKDTQEKIFEANSNSTFNQNIATWEAFGLCKKTGSNTLLVLDIDNTTFDEIVEKVKWNLFVKSKKKECQRLKDSIIVRVLFIENKLPSNLTLDLLKQKTEIGLTKEKIKKDIGLLDKMLSKDKIFVNAIANKWLEEK